jgi:hypothetical protein
MRNRKPREETGRVLAVAAALWGSVVGMAALGGTLARFDATSLAMLTAFVSLFAVASYFLDPQLRAYAKDMNALRTSALAVALAAAFVVALAFRSVPLAMFLAPLAGLAAAAAITRAAPRPGYVNGTREVTWREPGRDLSSAYQRSTFGRASRCVGRCSQRCAAQPSTMSAAVNPSAAR